MLIFMCPLNVKVLAINNETQLYFSTYTFWTSRLSYLNAAFIITCSYRSFSKTDKAVYPVPKIKLKVGQCLVPQTK
jgi:hypothetical protein